MQDNRPDRYIIKDSVLSIRVLTSKLMDGNILFYMFGIVLFFVMTEGVANIIGVIFPSNYFAEFAASLPPKYASLVPNMPYSSVLYTFIMLGAFEFGRTLFQLCLLRNGTFEYMSIFEGFSVFFRTLIISLIRSIMTSLGLFLFIVPGIMAHYYYRQAFFILADDISKGPIQCLRESRQMMEGNKLTMFKLDFSFILIYVISNLPVTIASSMISNTIYGMVLYTIARIPVYIVLGNMYINRTVFYELLVSKGFMNFKYKNEELFRTWDSNEAQFSQADFTHNDSSSIDPEVGDSSSENSDESE